MSSHLLTHLFSSTRRALAIALGGLALVPAGALAETTTPTYQARAARAEFLAYAPAPTSPSAVCVVDTGLDLNPDVNGHVIARTALHSADSGPGDVGSTKGP